MLGENPKFVQYSLSVSLKDKQAPYNNTDIYIQLNILMLMTWLN